MEGERGYRGGHHSWSGGISPSRSLRSVVVIPDQTDKTASTRQNRGTSAGTSQRENQTLDAQHENQVKFDERRKQCQRIRSRFELLETKVMLPAEFMRSMQWNCGPIGPMRTGGRLKPIAIVLRPNESLTQHEDNFKNWLEKRNVSFSMLRCDPEEERRYRQVFAYVRATSADTGIMNWDDTEEERSTARQRSRSRSRSRRGREGKRSASREFARNNEERKLKRSRFDYDNDHGGSLGSEAHASKMIPQQHDSSTTERAESVALQMKQLEEKLNHRVRELEQEVKRLSNSIENGANAYWSTPSSTTFSGVQEAKALESHSLQRINTLPSVKSEPGQLRLVVAEVLKKAALVNADPVKKRLVKDYTRLSNQVSQNELELGNSVFNAKMIQATIDLDAAKHFEQIEKLTVSISNDGRRRDTALAAVIAQEWRGRQEELRGLVRQVDSIDTPCVSHEQLTTIYSQLGRNGEDLVRLKSKLKNGLSLINAGRDNHVLELQDLSSELEAVLSERSALEDQRKFLCVELLHSNAAIYNLSMELIEEAHLWLA